MREPQFCDRPRPGNLSQLDRVNSPVDVFDARVRDIAILVGDEWIDAPRGSFVLVPSGVTHDFENRGDVKAGVLNFFLGVFEPAMPSIAEWFQKHPPGRP